MTERVMLSCGCAANAYIVRDNKKLPSCAIHDCSEPAAEEPDLDGRMARCSCKRTRPSNKELAFFEYRGDGSRSAITMCANCSYSIIAHERPKNNRPQAVCDNFTPKGAFEFDSYYCGHGGWD